MNALRILGQNRYLDVALVAVALLILAAQVPSRRGQHDFAHYYVSSQLLLDGQSPYGIPLKPELRQHGFTDLIETDISQATNPPTLLWMFVPFVILPQPLGFAAWVLVEAACLVAVLVLTRHLIGDRLNTQSWRLFCAVVIVSPAVYWHFHFSQVQLLLTVFILSAFALHRRGFSAAACLLVCAAGLLKLFPFVLLPWFIWRGASSWPKRAKNTLWCALMIATGVWISGPALWGDFLTEGRQAILAWAKHGQLNYTVASWIYNLASMAAVSTSQGWVVDIAWPIAVAAGLGLIGWGYFQCWRFQPSASRGQDEQLEFSLLCTVMLCGSATAWVHYQVLLIFPFACALSLVQARPTQRNVACFCAAVAAVFLHGNIFLESKLPTHLAILLSYLPLYGLLFFCWFLTRIVTPSVSPTNEKAEHAPEMLTGQSDSISRPPSAHAPS